MTAKKTKKSTKTKAKAKFKSVKSKTQPKVKKQKKRTKAKVKTKSKTKAKKAMTAEAIKPLDPAERLDIISSWKKRKLRKQMVNERKLSNYINRLVEKYPEEYLDKIREGISNDETFKKTANELSFDMNTTSSQTDEEFLDKFARDVKIDIDDE